MAYLIRNLRPGTLVIALTDVVLEPDASRKVEALSEPLQHAARKGYIAVEEIEGATVLEAADEHSDQAGKLLIEVHGPDDEPPPAPPAPSLAGFNVTDAVTSITAVTDVAKLEAFLAAETRKTVVAALNRRIAELTGGPKP